jgi:uncharacterized membrane protein
MENRFVGLLVIGIAALMVFIVLSFNLAMTDIVNASCSHGASCPMWGTIAFQTNMSIAIIAVVAVIGIFLTFFGDSEMVTSRFSGKIEVKEINKEHYEDVLSTLKPNEKQVLEQVIEAKGTVFQSEIVEKTEFSRVKVTRVLDSLEGKGLIERKRRGMTNVVVLKH